jgi:hypothetical protein
VIRVLACSFALVVALILANISLPAALADPEITLSPDSGKVGTGVHVTGTGFPPLLKVHLTFAGQPVGGDISSNNKGKFQADFVVPSSRPGSAQVVADTFLGIGASATFDVNASNNPPVAHDLSVSTVENSKVDVKLSADDPDGDPLTFAVVDGPHHGTLTGNITAGIATYTPTANFSGPDSFTFKANDGTADSNVATAFLTVGAVAAPRPPAPSENPQPALHAPSKENQNISQRLSISDRISTDLSVAPSTQANAGNDEKSTGASFGPNMWLLIGSVAGAGAIAAFLMHRRRTSSKVLEGTEEFGPQEDPAGSAADMMALENTGEQTPVMEEARRIFRMLNDEKSVAARKRMYDVAFGRTPPDGSYEYSKALVKGQFKQIGYMVMSDPLLNAMFMDSFAKVTIKVWRVLADEVEREMQSDRGLEPLARLGKEAERYWLEHNREPIEVY